MDALVTAANLHFVAGYLTTDLLRVRLLSIAGTLLLATYFLHLPEPIWTVVAWNHVFLALNLWQLSRLARARRTRTGPAGTPSAGCAEVPA